MPVVRLLSRGLSILDVLEDCASPGETKSVEKYMQQLGILVRETCARQCQDAAPFDFHAVRGLIGVAQLCVADSRLDVPSGVASPEEGDAIEVEGAPDRTHGCGEVAPGNHALGGQPSEVLGFGVRASDLYPPVGEQVDEPADHGRDHGECDQADEVYQVGYAKAVKRRCVVEVREHERDHSG